MSPRESQSNIPDSAPSNPGRPGTRDSNGKSPWVLAQTQHTTPTCSIRYDGVGEIRLGAYWAPGTSSRHRQQRDSSLVCTVPIPAPGLGVTRGIVHHVGPCAINLHRFHHLTMNDTSHTSTAVDIKDCSEFRSRHIRVYGPTATGSNKTDGRCGPDPGSVYYWFTPRGCSGS